MANEIENRIKEKLGVGPQLDADVTDRAPAPAARVGNGAGNGAGVPRIITTPGVTV
jgi:recombination protein RecA